MQMASVSVKDGIACQRDVRESYHGTEAVNQKRILNTHMVSAHENRKLYIYTSYVYSFIIISPIVLVVHAIENGIYSALKNNDSKRLSSATVYTTLFPGHHDAKLMIQSGIKELVYWDDKYMQQNHAKAAKKLFDTAGIVYRYMYIEVKIACNCHCFGIMLTISSFFYLYRHYVPPEH